MGTSLDIRSINGIEEKDTRTSLELLYHVSREFAAALDLRTVLQRVLFLSMQTVGAMTGSIIVLDDNGKPVESALITGSHLHDHTTQRLRITLERGLAGWVVRNHQAVLITDTRRDERWISRKYEPDEERGPKSAVSAPLMVRERLVGVMTLVHQTPGFFSQQHLELVQAISDQAGIAVLNARLYADSQRQARVMTALAESAAAITASLNTENVLVRILEQISQALRVQAVSLALIDSKKEELTFRAAIGWENMESITSRIKIGQGIAGWVAREGRGVIIPETMTDSRFDPEINRRTGLSVEAIACAPIRSRGELIGVLEAVNPNDGVFDSDALFVLTGIGSLAGTAIRHAQLFESLQAAHQRYRELFEDSIDLLMITNWEGNILEANRQAELISGYNKQDLLGMKISQLHKLDEEKTGTYFSILAEGTTVTYESQLQTKQEQPIPIQVYVRQVYIEELAHLQWIFRDITERKNLDTLREDLLSMIYHDLQSPLANVVSSLDIIGTLLYPAQDTSLTSMVNIAKRSTDRIQRLTNSLLDINRLEAGQPVRNRLAINPAFLAQDAVETVFPLTQSKNQELINNVPAGLPQVLVDGDMIRRVLVNLLENAIKYTQQNGKIQLGGDQDDGWIKLWVEDNGPAVPDSEHERIFQKFTRLSYREAPKGLGLGLTYCRLAVEGHGGKIWLDSKLKAGARFVFTLPIAINPA